MHICYIPGFLKMIPISFTEYALTVVELGFQGNGAMQKVVLPVPFSLVSFNY